MKYQKKQLFEIIAETLETSLNNINEDSSVDSVNSWDSYAHLNLILALEREFQISFDDSEVVDLLNIKLIISALEKHNITFT